MKKLLTLSLIALTVTACAPRHCDQHYSVSCAKADKTKAYIWGDAGQTNKAGDTGHYDMTATGKPLGGGQ